MQIAGKCVRGAPDLQVGVYDTVDIDRGDSLLIGRGQGPDSFHIALAKRSGVRSPMRMATATFLLALIAHAPIGIGPALAQAAGPALTLELNAAEPSEKGCRLTFVVNNKLGGYLVRAAFELALFNRQGVVDRLTVLDFRDMPEGKTKVSRFDLAGADCTNISRLLVNQVTECQGNGIEASSCMLNLKTETKTSIVFGL